MSNMVKTVPYHQGASLPWKFQVLLPKGASLFLSVLKLDACLLVSHGSSDTLLGSPRHSSDWKKTQRGTDLKSPNWARKRQSKKSSSWELGQSWGDAWYIPLLNQRAASAAACSFPVLLKGFGFQKHSGTTSCSFRVEIGLKKHFFPSVW